MYAFPFSGQAEHDMLKAVAESLGVDYFVDVDLENVKYTGTLFADLELSEEVRAFNAVYGD